MELLNNILKYAVCEGKVKIECTVEADFERIICEICFQTLAKISDILKDKDLSDFDCIERIVCVMENTGINSGSRHDLG